LLVLKKPPHFKLTGHNKIAFRLPDENRSSQLPPVVVNKKADNGENADDLTGFNP
jgi:hypothetical protein